MPRIRSVTSFSVENQVRATQLARIDADRASDLDFFARSCRAVPNPELVEKYTRLRRVGLLNLGDVLRAEGFGWDEEIHLAGRRYALGEDFAAAYLGLAPCPEDDEDDISCDDELAEMRGHYADAVRVG